MKEEHKITPNMEKFFSNLLEIKEFVKEKYEKNNDPTLKEIYKRLDLIIKEKGLK